MITCRAPGKLFIAGEYAVVQPGGRAVLTAVDRYASATVVDAADSDTVLQTELGPAAGTRLACRRTGGRLAPVGGVVPPQLSYVFAAAEVVDRLLGERGIRPRPFRLAVTSALADPSGRKFGLGSSAAVTVATVRALGRFHELGLSQMDRYRLSMLATAAVSPRASGGDVAASTWGGWIAYGSPDRAAIVDMAARAGVHAALRARWPGLSVRPLPEPSGLVLRVGWTGTPASTPSMIAALDSRGDASFISGSAQCVQRLIAAAEADDGAAVQSEIRCARELLIALDHSVGGGIMTPRLRALCEAGEAVGAAAKPSGAGGGDCGIALLPRVRPAADAELTGRWIRAGIQPLDLHTSQYFQNDP